MADARVQELLRELRDRYGVRLVPEPPEAVRLALGTWVALLQNPSAPLVDWSAIHDVLMGAVARAALPAWAEQLGIGAAALPRLAPPPAPVCRVAGCQWTPQADDWYCLTHALVALQERGRQRDQGARGEGTTAWPFWLGLPRRESFAFPVNCGASDPTFSGMVCGLRHDHEGEHRYVAVP